MNEKLPQAESKALLNVKYDHYHLPDQSDLYVTQFGRPFAGMLHPDNWFERDWFKKSREKLQGTSRVYKVRTKAVDSRSKDLVVKWCRVGEAVPMDTFTLNKFVEAEFNSPYEEFSLLMEMRKRGRPTLRTHKPLAIYVPAKRLELWQTGRSQNKMAQKKAKFRDVELDIYRQYILIYEWIKGVSATTPEALAAAEYDAGPVEEGSPPAKSFADQMLTQSISEMWQAGFRVLDVKPQHVIVRPLPSGGLLKTKDGRTAYALVDFELLARTPAYEEEVKRSRRQDYLERQRDRFAPSENFPEHLHPTRIWGVDYVHGDCQSTNGKLWVVGHDAELFDYFQPERWRRTPRTSLSDTAQVYHTKTKDEIQLVWKVSHVGDMPDAEASPMEHLGHGHNSPFEEFAFALQLQQAGVPTTYPRAIYMLGHLSTLPPDILDPRRYDLHEGLTMPDGEPILQRQRNYISIWGYWNGLDEDLAKADSYAHYCHGINARQALAKGVISKREYTALMKKAEQLLASAGFISTWLKGTHFLLTMSAADELLRDPDHTPIIRFCNFEFLKKLG